MEKEVKRIKMIVAYDGTNYKGWQVQPNGITIEEVLNRHLSSLLGEEITVTGASRTDSGVHSLGNVAIFDTTTRMPADKISFALNQRLPEDIVVQGSCEVPADWHPRYQNSRKTYEYIPYADETAGYLFLPPQPGCGEDEPGGGVPGRGARF